MEACELLALEHQLDGLDAELAVELPAHLRAFAHAYARGERPPPAPAAILRPATLATARAALAHPLLADRGLTLLRLALPAAIDSEPAVAAARAASPTWPALAALARARDAAAARLWPLARSAASGPSPAIDRLHRLHGLVRESVVRIPDSAPASAVPASVTLAVRPADKVIGDAATSPFVVPGATMASMGAAGASGSPARTVDAETHACLPAAVDGWMAPDGVVVDEPAIERAWAELASAHGVAGSVQFLRSSGRPRTFVVAPGREVIVVVPDEIAAPAARFAVLHELGHALAALAAPVGLPRPVDEAAAAYAARAVERPGRWFSPLARAARQRRLALARRLDELERRLPDLAARFTEQPPWALWHDPGAQAAYVAAEALADQLDCTLGPTPRPGAFAAALAAQRDALDRRAG